MIHKKILRLDKCCHHNIIKVVAIVIVTILSTPTEVNINIIANIIIKDICHYQHLKMSSSIQIVNNNINNNNIWIMVGRRGRYNHCIQQQQQIKSNIHNHYHQISSKVQKLIIITLTTLTT